MEDLNILKNIKIEQHLGQKIIDNTLSNQNFV